MQSLATFTGPSSTGFTRLAVEHRDKYRYRSVVNQVQRQLWVKGTCSSRTSIELQRLDDTFWSKRRGQVHSCYHFPESSEPQCCIAGYRDSGKCEDCPVCYHPFPKTEYARPLLDARTDAALIAGRGHSRSSALKALATSCEYGHHSTPSQSGVISNHRTLAGM